MVNFDKVSFLRDYWQKKPMVIRHALPGFINPLSPDELAGLALEEEIESRLVSETPETAPYWHLKRGPFQDRDFSQLPQSHWTLLVQGVDRFIPEVAAALNHFDFIPQWRVDDVMISYAAAQGSVGPHYDNYDVFLYQAKGARKWFLTSKNCHPENYLSGLDLRIMKDFDVEEEFLLEEGDMLYLPAHVGHYGIAADGDCMTWSFGYRSYQSLELLDSFADYLTEQSIAPTLYQDPDWTTLKGAGEIPMTAVSKAKEALARLLDDEHRLTSWFGCFATQLDQQAEQLLPMPLTEEELVDEQTFINQLTDSNGLERNPVCRFAYTETKGSVALFINGCEWELGESAGELAKLIANSRELSIEELKPYLNDSANQKLLYDLWRLLWLELNLV